VRPWGRAAGQAASGGLLVAFTIGAGLRDGHHGQVPLLDVWGYNGVYLVAALACWSPRSRAGGMLLAWRLVAIALGLGVVANVCFSLGTTRGPSGGGPVLAGLSDVLYLASYPACCVAVVLAVRARVPRFPASLWWDGAVTALGTAAVLLCLPGVRRLAGAGAEHGWAALLYPVADVGLVALLAAGVVVLQGHGDRVLLTAGVGLGLIATGDVLDALRQASGGLAEGGFRDVVDLLGVFLVGLAAGVRRRVRAPSPVGTAPALQWPVLVVPSVSAAGSVALLAAPAWGNPPSRALATGCVLAALVRMFLTLREARELAEARRQARTDDLTGLLNRRAFTERCDAVVRAASLTVPATLVLLDLDRFKQINDSLGHATGDAVLVRVAERLRRSVPPGAVVSRLAGDEFAVLLPGVPEERALDLTRGIDAAVSRGVTVGRVTVGVSTSIGVACAPEAARTTRELLRCADVAMYRAKADGGGPQPYSAVHPSDAVECVRTADELRGALDRRPGAGRLVVHLQPQVRPVTGEVAGMEALVRWEHPVHGLLPPAAFLPAARAAGLMGDVTARVLDLALATCRACWDGGYRLPVSVNVSAAGLHDGTLSATVDAALHRHALPAGALVVELTEDTLMTHPDHARGVLQRLRTLGVGVSIDDYGTGYSTLAYLRRLPVDELKLDRVFLQDLADDPAAGAIVRHTVDLAHSLGIRVVAEGVEDGTTLGLVGRLGGDIAQGYHVARPMPADQLVRWLASYRAPGPAAAGPPGAAPVPRPEVLRP